MTLEQLDDYQTVLARLVEEREPRLARTLAKCVTPIDLRCVKCGAVHTVNAQCKKRWCPLCAPRISARRLERCEHLAKAMQWPLYLCCTIRNVPDDEASTCIRTLKDMSKRFRRGEWWRQTQLGGVWAIEVTNIGNGWHPHINYLVDSRWLAVDAPAPRRGDSTEEIAAKCKAAQAELCENWSWFVGDDVTCWVERAHGRAATEVMKYSVKSADLVKFPGRIAPIIGAIDDGRLMQRFGASYGMKWPKVEREPMTCDDCGHAGYIENDFRLSMKLARTKDARASMSLSSKLYAMRQTDSVIDNAAIFRLKAERTGEKIQARRAHLTEQGLDLARRSSGAGGRMSSGASTCQRHTCA